MKKLDDLINAYLIKIYKKQGNHMSELITHWNKIVGTEFANSTNPSKIRSQIYKGQKINILYINVINSSKAIEISYSESLILERIAIYLGKRIVDRLRVQVVLSEND